MQAIVITRPLPLDHPDCFVRQTLPTPSPGPNELLVAVQAIAVNPVDYKQRRARSPEATEPRILGWDASGIVTAVGPGVTLFRPGDEVYYAGDVTRPGSNAGFQLVDEAIASRKPASLSHEDAAAIPLTAITAWECLFDRLRWDPDQPSTSRGQHLLILSGAGGVGSIGIQIARHFTEATVVATASRPESAEWCRSLGAHHIVNHHEDWPARLRELGIPQVDAIACFADTASHWQRMIEALRPQGTITAIVESAAIPDIGLLKPKSLTFAWEFMFTRPMFQTPDRIAQHHLLNRVAEAIDQGKIRTTRRGAVEDLSPVTLAAAHRQLEQGDTIGKIVLRVPDSFRK